VTTLPTGDEEIQGVGWKKVGWIFSKLLLSTFLVVTNSFEEDEALTRIHELYKSHLLFCLLLFTNT